MDFLGQMGHLETLSRKETGVLLDFVQMREGGPCPNFLAPFHKCIFGQLKDPIILCISCSCEGPGDVPDGQTGAPWPRCQGRRPATTSHLEVGGAPPPRSTGFPASSPEKRKYRTRIHRIIICFNTAKIFCFVLFV